jgi:hypothetical protein
MISWLLTSRVGWVFLGAAVLVLQADRARACNVPVFRYGLERWPADPYVVSVSSNLARAVLGAVARDHHANLFVEISPADQQEDIVVRYPTLDGACYAGKWETGLLNLLFDSPLRRRIAAELLTGVSAVWVMVEGMNTASNDAVFAMIEDRNRAAEKSLKLPEVPDYEDEADGRSRGAPVAGIPLKLSFTRHRLSRADPSESLLIRTLVGMDPALADVEAPFLVIVFGRGRAITVVPRDVSAGNVDYLNEFLVGPCSCTIKDAHPGEDLPMAVNWEDAVRGYPETCGTILPEGVRIPCGGTNALAAVTAAHPSDRGRGGQSGGGNGSPARPVLIAVAVLLPLSALVFTLVRGVRRGKKKEERV